MSIQCGVDCLDCKVGAPGIGDGGFLGTPGLARPGEAPPSMEGPNPSFGYFHDALIGMGIRPYDLDRFREFLVAHDGHRLFLSSDHDDQTQWPKELQEFEAEYEDNEPIDEHLRERADRERRVAAGEFIHARYEISCPKCSRSISSEEPELLRAMEPLAIDIDAATIFVERWGSTPDTGWNHRLMGIADPWDPLMEQLVEFVTTHMDHGLQAKLKA